MLLLGFKRVLGLGCCISTDGIEESFVLLDAVLFSKCAGDVVRAHSFRDVLLLSAVIGLDLDGYVSDRVVALGAKEADTASASEASEKLERFKGRDCLSGTEILKNLPILRIGAGLVQVYILCLHNLLIGF